MFDGETLSLDAQATVLACSSVGLPRDVAIRPYGPRGWAKVATRLAARATGPGAMLGISRTELAELLGDAVPDDLDRLGRLLSRGPQLGFELDRLQSRGIWIRTLSDADYPTRLRAALGPDAPPVLFGAGEPSLLGRGGVAIVGSRDVDERATELTRALAAAIARSGSVVISGGARGVDQVAMQAAFEAGGSAVGALPEGIEKRIRESATRAALADGSAVLISPYHPSAGFSAGAAMARNKIVYGLSDLAVIISSANGSGGTWAGAVEALSAGWVPVLIRDDDDAPAGNRQLIDRGGRPIRLETIHEIATASDLLDLALPTQGRVAETPDPYEQQQLALTE